MIYIPKNQRLRAQLAPLTAAMPPVVPRIDLRAEDMPAVMNGVARRGGEGIAFTGDDLLDDWLAAGNALDARIRRSRIPWNEPQALYGKPTLCLITPQGRDLDPANDRIGICERYRNLAADFLASVYGRGTDGVMYFSGETEQIAALGIVDAVIDIVLTGRTIARLGLGVSRVIYRSDIARLEIDSV